MKKNAWLAMLSFMLVACNSVKQNVNVEPKNGTIVVPAKGEYRQWNNQKHSAFSLTLTNADATASVEVYKVKANGNEKWIQPSLQAQKELQLNIPTNGGILLKNFNDRPVTITFSVN